MLYSGERYLDLVIFRDTPYEAVRGILERCPVRMVDADEILLSPKKETGSFYQLLDGALTVHLHNANSRPIATVRVGECVGELSVIDEKSATAFVKAVEPCRLLEMQSDDLWALIHIDPKIAKNLLRTFSHRMRGNTAALTDSLLMQTVPDIVYRLDKDGNFIFLNDAVEKLGYTQDELLGRHFEQLISGEDVDKVSYAPVVERIRQGQSAPVCPPGLFDERRAFNRKTTGLEVRLKRKAGARVEAEASGMSGEIIADVSCTGIREVVVNEGYGSFVGTIGIIRDITERKRLQAQVEEQKARMEAIFNTAVDAIIVVDGKGIMEAINQAASRIFGYPEPDMLGHNISMLMGDTRWELHDRYLTRYSATGHSTAHGSNREEVGVRRDGSHLPLEVSVSEVNLMGRVLFTAIVRDITERKSAERIIYFQANYDDLTKLPNRVLFRRTLEQKLVEARSRGRTLALIFIDLDRFKWINDNLGHPAGDALLQESANRLKRKVGEENMVARLGGDEFTVLLAGEEMDGEAIATTARELLEQLNRPFLLQEQEVYISGSLGIARFPHDAMDMETLLKKADEAMYMSKSAGKNAYHFITGENLILEKKYAPATQR